MENLMSIIGDDNSVTLADLSNESQNMRELLDDKCELNYVNCDNLDIIVDSALNRINFIKCQNIKLTIDELIYGVEVSESSDVSIMIKKHNKQNKYLIDSSTDISVCLPIRNQKNIDYLIKNSKSVRFVGDDNEPIISS